MEQVQYLGEPSTYSAEKPVMRKTRTRQDFMSGFVAVSSLDFRSSTEGNLNAKKPTLPAWLLVFSWRNLQWGGEETVELRKHT
jgi:hypothetical protein